jgi:uncharacterized protein YjbI with pentapeptide repeats
MASLSLADKSRANLGGGASPGLSLADLARVALAGSATLSLADLAYAEISSEE